MAYEGTALVCGAGHRVPVRSGYVDASAAPPDTVTKRTFRSFGYEWNTFEEIPGQDEVSWHEYFADVPLEDLKGRVALDAGCGQGRFTKFTARRVDAMVALDGSDAVVAAAKTLAGMPNAAVTKADLRRAPFAPESFDFISCLGVLHHLPDPEEGFRSLVRLLAPGGIVLLYLYSRPQSSGFRATALGAAAVLRKVTVRLPHPVLRAVSAPIAMGLTALVILPGRFGEATNTRFSGLPLAAYRHRPFRSLWLDTFDRLSAPIENRYTWEEVEHWFRDAGLNVEAVSHATGLTILARRAADHEVPCTSLA
jgi:SAM-dependent methyltransferase